jgi:hypothetical protein
MFGAFTFTAQVKDSGGAQAQTKTVTCTITIVPAPLLLVCPPNQGKAGSSYTGSLVATGGVPPYVFSIVSGSLPTGLALNTTTGAITGTPTVYGTFSFTAKVVDSRGGVAGTATSNCTITIKPNFVTYTRGGWGQNPQGQNTGTILQNGFSSVFGAKLVIGGKPYAVTLTSPAAVRNFIANNSGTPGVLTKSATNPGGTNSRTFGSQVVALTCNIAFSNAGVLPHGLANYTLPSGPLAGYTVQGVLTLANNVIAGNLSALPSGMTVSTLNNVVDSINNMFHPDN